MSLQNVAASQTNASIGGGSKVYIKHLVIVPDTTAAGTVVLSDGANDYTMFVTGTLADLSPITIPIESFNVAGAWTMDTGANVHVIVVSA